MRHTLSRYQPYRPEQLFDLVADVERYPEFVPWLVSLRTWGRETPSEGVTTLKAEAAVGFSFLKERFATRVLADRPALRIETSLLSGPFRRLLNEWRFEGEGEGARVHFLIDFEFKSRLLDQMLAANFQRAVDALIGCFDARAQALYGERS